MKAATVSGPSASIRASRSPAHFLAKVPFAHARLGVPVVVRQRRMQDAVQGQVELGMKTGQAGEAARHDRRAVVAAMARDDLALFRASEDVVVVPGDLDVGLVGVRSRHAVVDLAHVGRRHAQHPVAEADDGLVGTSPVGMEVGQLVGLFGDRLGDLGAAIADVDAIEGGESVQQPAAVLVDDVDALAALDDLGLAAGGVGIKLGQRVQDALAVHFLQAQVIGGVQFHGAAPAMIVAEGMGLPSGVVRTTLFAAFGGRTRRPAR